MFRPLLESIFFTHIQSNISNPRNPITETENGSMEPKYCAFRFGDWTPQSSSSAENMTMDAYRERYTIQHKHHLSSKVNGDAVQNGPPWLPWLSLMEVEEVDLRKATTAGFSVARHGELFATFNANPSHTLKKKKNRAIFERMNIFLKARKMKTQKAKH